MADPHTKALRQLLAEERGIVTPSASNALTACIVADPGFRAGYLTGTGLMNTHPGISDLGLMNLAQLAGHTMKQRYAATEAKP